MLACISGCRGVIGCKVATGGVLRAKKFAQRTKNGPKSAFYAVLGESFSRTGSRGIPRGELCCAVGLVAGPFYWQC